MVYIRIPPMHATDTPSPPQVNHAAIDQINRIRTERGEHFPRYAVFIVAYNAAAHLVSVLKRIPQPIYDLLEEIYIFDDFSRDETTEIARQYVADAGLGKVSVYRNPRNYGYGGNQKLGYEYAIARGYDYVILLHGDGQYAPESLPDLILPTLISDAQIVFGSRMMQRGQARQGGMPLYKYVGNRILTTFENLLLGERLSEYHSGYRLYGTRFLRRVQYPLNTDDFHFDTQIILQAHLVEEPIVEVPIPTYYGDEICHVNGMKYAADVAMSVLDFRLHQIGVTRRERYIPVEPVHYTFKDFAFSSHRQILDSIVPGQSVLDLGCGTGLLAEHIAAKGCTVTGVDVLPPEKIDPRLRYHCRNLEDPAPLPFDREFDCVVLGDIIEHVIDATGLLMRVRSVLRENGRLIVSTPNIALWVNRLALLCGRFDYSDKGILDRTHVHLYTQASLRDLLGGTGFRIVRERAASIPFPLVIRQKRLSWAANLLNRVYGALAWVWPRMFAYQFVFTAEIRQLEWKEMQALPEQYRQPHPHLPR